MINKQIIWRLLSFLMLIESVFLALALIVSIIYKGSDLYAFAVTLAITLTSGVIINKLTKKANKDFGKREGYIIVSLVWVVFSIFGCLPYIISGSIPSITNAFFETMSGFTTTGASILDNIEQMPKGILFWRSLTQWMGGMGIIVLSLAVLPFLGIGGMQLYSAEVPGLTADKFHPRVKETAQRLWIIYVGFTAAEALLLWIGGMGPFDAINHALTTMATGGYSTKQASIAYYNSPFIQYVIIAFMFIAGVNFALAYFALKLNFKKVLRNEEFKIYLLITFIFTAIITIRLLLSGHGSFEQSFRDALFQVVSIITTTGYITYDYLLWPPLIVSLIFLLMFVGGSSGSTSGGIKVIRVALILKNCAYELKRLVHPKAIIPLKLNDKAVPQTLVNNVLAFIVFYLLIFMGSSVMLTALGIDMNTALGAVATSLGNIGPGLGLVGPAYSFSAIPEVAKWILSFLMLLGRLELFTVLILFAPSFWRS